MGIFSVDLPPESGLWKTSIQCPCEEIAVLRSQLQQCTDILLEVSSGYSQRKRIMLEAKATKLLKDIQGEP